MANVPATAHGHDDDNCVITEITVDTADIDTLLAGKGRA